MAEDEIKVVSSNDLDIWKPTRHPVRIQWTHIDSMEEPESSCANTMITIRSGEKVFYFLNTSPERVIETIDAWLNPSPMIVTDACIDPALPIYGVIAKFRESFVINWEKIMRSIYYPQRTRNETTCEAFTSFSP